jgi:hypothetical protein
MPLAVTTASNGIGIPVVSVGNGMPVIEVANGLGMPVVIATNGRGMPVTFVSGEGSATPSPPSNVLAPAITDLTPTEGELVTVNPGSWSGFPYPTFSYQWFHADDTATPIATGSSYTILEADIGEDLIVKVVGTNDGGADTEYSNTVGPVVEAPEAPANVTPPVITGSPVYEATLTVTNTGGWLHSPTSYTYQWFKTTDGTVASGVPVVPADTDTSFTVPPEPMVPVIGSAAAVNVAENVALNHALTADQMVTWSKVGGADTGLFLLTGSTLMLPAKNFEAPADADANNIYTVTVRATNATSGLYAEQTINVTVTDVAETFDYLVDELGNRLVDELGNPLTTG